MYLNCPFCPAQAYSQGTSDFMLGIGFQHFECICKHEFFVPKEDLNGRREVVQEQQS